MYHLEIKMTQKEKIMMKMLEMKLRNPRIVKLEMLEEKILTEKKN